MTNQYNATVREIWSDGTIGTFVAHVEMINNRLQMTRSNSVTYTGYEDKIGELVEGSELREKYGEKVALYDVYIRESNPTKTYEIILDNCEGYRNLFENNFASSKPSKRNHHK